MGCRFHFVIVGSSNFYFQMSVRLSVCGASPNSVVFWCKHTVFRRQCCFPPTRDCETEKKTFQSLPIVTIFWHLNQIDSVFTSDGLRKGAIRIYTILHCYCNLQTKLNTMSFTWYILKNCTLTDSTLPSIKLTDKVRICISMQLKSVKKQLFYKSNEKQ